MTNEISPIIEYDILPLQCLKLDFKLEGDITDVNQENKTINDKVSVEVTSEQKNALKDYEGKEVIFGVRPEDIELNDEGIEELKNRIILSTNDSNGKLFDESIKYNYKKLLDFYALKRYALKRI